MGRNGSLGRSRIGVKRKEEKGKVWNKIKWKNASDTRWARVVQWMNVKRNKIAIISQLAFNSYILTVSATETPIAFLTELRKQKKE